MISIRLPEKLIKEIDKLGEENGWTTTDLILTALDQFVQWEKRDKN